MNKFFTFLILPSLALIGFNTIAQESHFACGLNKKLQELYAKDPTLEADQAKLLAKARHTRKEKAVDQTVYTIPIVFHVIHEYGSENITDAQVVDQVNILNRDYRLMNGDTTNIVPEYRDLKSDIFIEFKLATIDPYGNCTNGIEHIYSHETNNGDDNSKLNQWHRSQYLNVWVVNSMRDGVAGYAFYPGAVDGNNFYIDGIIILDGHIGSIGTGSEGNSRSLTHEIGHYLGLSHTWGNTNDPEVGCGDDGYTDTPPTKGHKSCALVPNASTSCTFNSNLTATYDFASVKLTTGLTDPGKPVMVPLQSTIDDFGHFKAVGTSAQPVDSLRFSFSNWPLGGLAVNQDTTYASLTGAIDLAKYYEITIDPADYSTMTFTDLDFSFQRSLTGPRTYAVRSSIDGYAANLGTAVSTNAAISVRPNDVFFSLKDTANNLVGSHIDLPAVPFQNLTSAVTFRVYAWNAEDIAGSFSIDNFKVTLKETIVENVQNYMEYSYCSYMFTIQQAEDMRFNLTSDVASRSNLITAANHTTTGIDVLAPPVCTPKADFKASKKFICSGTTVTFTDVSWRAAVDSRTWTFEGGTPATSTTPTQNVVFDTPGYKKITLSVTNANGTDVEERADYIYVSPSWPDHIGPYSNDLNGTQADWFLKDNPEDNFAKFELVAVVGKDNSTCYKLNNYRDLTGAAQLSDLAMYYNRLGGVKDRLISPSYDLSNTTNVTISFDYAYATDGTVLTTSGENVADITEQVKVYVSKNCGDSPSLKKTLSGATLLTAGFAANTNFVPANNSQWKTCEISYNPSSTDDQSRVIIEFVASDKSNNLYIDNFNVTGTLGLVSEEINALELMVYPNPVSSKQSITVSYVAGNNPVELILRDVQGKIIHSETVSTTNTTVEHTLDTASKLTSSCYFLEVKTGTASTIKKVVVL